MSRSTIKEIARLCGVSRATVSAVLHGKPWVSDETRRAVQRVLREQDYQKHLIDHTLSERFGKVIGVVLGNIRNPFNSELITGLQEALSRHGYFTLQHTTDESYEGEIEAIRALETYNLGGYVVAPVQEGKPHDHLRAIRDSGKPLVSIGKVPDLETHVVDFDDQRASKETTDHLIGLGHRRIVCLAGPETSSFARHRILGFVESLMDHGLPFSESSVLRAGATFTQGCEAATEALSRGDDRPTALLCFNDLVAMGAYKAAYDLKVRIPDDLSIVGFDNSQLSAVMGPPLTTVATWPSQVGQAAAEILLQALNSPPPTGYLHRMTVPVLVERASVRHAAEQPAASL